MVVVEVLKIVVVIDVVVVIVVVVVKVLIVGVVFEDTVLPSIQIIYNVMTCIHFIK